MPFRTLQQAGYTVYKAGGFGVGLCVGSPNRSKGWLLEGLGPCKYEQVEIKLQSAPLFALGIAPLPIKAFDSPLSIGISRPACRPKSQGPSSKSSPG